MKEGDVEPLIARAVKDKFKKLNLESTEAFNRHKIESEAKGKNPYSAYLVMCKERKVNKDTHLERHGLSTLARLISVSIAPIAELKSLAKAFSSSEGDWEIAKSNYVQPIFKAVIDKLAASPDADRLKFIPDIIKLGQEHRMNFKRKLASLFDYAIETQSMVEMAPILGEILNSNIVSDEEEYRDWVYGCLPSIKLLIKSGDAFIIEHIMPTIDIMNKDRRALSSIEDDPDGEGALVVRDGADSGFGSITNEEMQEAESLLGHLASSTLTAHTGHFETNDRFQYDDALLVAAERFDRKDANYRSRGSDADYCVINGNRNFTDLLSGLESSTEAHRFQIADGHWISGEFQFDGDRNLTIAISDSLALGPKPYGATFELIAELRKSYPHAHILINSDYTQHTETGCRTHSTDNVRRMMQLPMLQDVEDTSFLEYAKRNAVLSTDESLEAKAPRGDFKSNHAYSGYLRNGVEFYPSPPNILISKTSTRLGEAITRGGVGEQAVNKKGHTANKVFAGDADARASYGMLFQWRWMNSQETEEKALNVRVEEKLEIAGKRAMKFIASGSDASIAAAKAAHTVEGYLARHQPQLKVTAKPGARL